MFSVECGYQYPCHLFLGNSQWKKIVTLDICDKIHLGGIVVLTLNWLFWWLQGYLLFSLVSKAASAVIDVTNYTCVKWHMWSIVPLTLRPGWFPRFEPSSRCVFPACCTASNTSKWVSELVSEWVSAAEGLSRGKTTGRVPESMTWSLLSSWSSIIFSWKQAEELRISMLSILWS